MFTLLAVSRASRLCFALIVTSLLWVWSCGSDTTPISGSSAGSAGNAAAGAGAPSFAGTGANDGGASAASGAGGVGDLGGTGGVAAGGASGSAGEAGADSSPARANLIFILADDLSTNLIEHMPNLQKMRQQGASFSNYFVSDSLCCPSRTSMFTGKYPHNSGVFTNSGADGGYATYLGKGNDPQTFAVALQQSGYRTAMMGKFLNGYDPLTNAASLGWGDWDVAGNGYPEFNYDLNQNGKVVHYGKAAADYLTDVLSGLGQAFIEHASSKPFLIELSTFAPHAPYTPAPRHAALFPDLVYPKTPAFAFRPTAKDPTWLQSRPALDAAQMANIETIFRKRVQAVQAIDEMIGALHKALKASGHDQDTYVFFTSDNGYHMGERSQLPGKQTAFDTDIHVPLIVTGPGIAAGSSIEEIAQNIDLCSTFAEIGQAPAPATVNGRSLLPLLLGQKVANWRNVALVEHHDPQFDPNDPDAETTGGAAPPTYNALRTANSVYVEYVGNETEYHDRTTDPYELDNTAAALSPARLSQLHDTVSAIKNCKTKEECWAAQHLAP